MELWLDTSDVDFVKKASRLGVLHGVTTNPTIAAKSRLSSETLIDKLLKAQSGPVAYQVMGSDTENMYSQGKALAELSKRVIVKIPVTREGLAAIYKLANEGVATLATAIFEPRQAHLAFQAGALYLAPYLGRITDTGGNGLEALGLMQKIKANYRFPGKILAAGIREVEEVLACLEMGIDSITVPEKVFTAFTEDNPQTLHALEKFAQDWQNASLTSSNYL